MTDSPPTTAHEPLLVSSDEAGRLCSMTGRNWRRLNSLGKVPRARKLGGWPRWSLEELRAWINAGCPTRLEWERQCTSAK